MAERRSSRKRFDHVGRIADQVDIAIESAVTESCHRRVFNFVFNRLRELTKAYHFVRAMKRSLTLPARLR